MAEAPTKLAFDMNLSRQGDSDVRGVVFGMLDLLNRAKSVEFKERGCRTKINGDVLSVELFDHG